MTPCAHFDYDPATGIGVGAGRSGTACDPNLTRLEIDAETLALVGERPDQFRYSIETGVIERRAQVAASPSAPIALPSEIERLRAEVRNHGETLIETNFWLRQLVAQLERRKIAGVLFLLYLLLAQPVSAGCTKSAGTATTTDSVIGDTVAHSTRCSFLIQNQSSTNDAYAEFGATAAVNTSIDVPPNGYWAQDLCSNPQARTFAPPLHVITSTGTAAVVFTECLF